MNFYNLITPHHSEEWACFPSVVEFPALRTAAASRIVIAFLQSNIDLIFSQVALSMPELPEASNTAVQLCILSWAVATLWW